MPHPGVVCELSPTHVAAARWNNSRGSLDVFAREGLPEGVIVPSPVEANVTNPEALRAAVASVFRRIPNRPPTLALLIPDPVVRVFIFPFETFPRRADEAAPLLRLRLKKSVPFDVEETVISWMRQSGREGKLEIVTAIARRQIVREYEEALEAAGLQPGVVLSSSIATLPLLEKDGATLFVRMSGRSFTTAIVTGDTLCVFRSSEMASGAAYVEPQAVLDEIFPAIAYFQDSWGATVDRVRVAGFGDREALLRQALENELRCAAERLGDGEPARSLPPEAQSLFHQELEPLVGWMMNGAA
jgi:type IV pilus assembly protein PilM